MSYEQMRITAIQGFGGGGANSHLSFSLTNVLSDPLSLKTH